ncbi:uncharacterized protein P884DRAFT_326084 [Thermothelomyces heterothallicus CBS 202.75]|uniref:uncharacterized protein n=1 Tax=Thermothelomyces heterothallicus CBS 202.75 TaxID=1149848 RepID=UPI003743EF50
MRLPSIPTSTLTTITTTTATTLLLSLLTLHGALAARARPKDAVLLSEVQALTLHGPDKMTTSRRTPPIPQLRCVSPAALCRLAGPVRTMRCTNQGAGYGGAEDAAWACAVAGGLPRAVRLDRTDVLCEGYASPDDPYVLRGSCGVEYTVRLTEEGRRRFPELVGVDDGQEGGGGGGGGGGGRPAGEKAAWLFWLLFFAVLAWIAYGAWTRRGTPGARPSGGANRRGWGGGGGGGGGWGPGFGPGGEDDPPPPYPRFGPKPSSSTESAWRPGFWSGLASGAAAGYVAANRGQRNHDRNRGRGRRGGLWRDNDGPGGWWSGSGPGPGSGSDSGLGSAWGARRSSSSGSGSRHESTGYGSTSRR